MTEDKTMPEPVAFTDADEMRALPDGHALMWPRDSGLSSPDPKPLYSEAQMRALADRLEKTGAFLERALDRASQLQAALAEARKVIEQAREKLAVYSDPTGYTDSTGEQLTADEELHPGLAAMDGVNICTEWLSAHPAKETKG